MKVAKYLWIAANILITLIILYFIPLESDIPGTDPPVRYAYINDHWGKFNFMWRSELLIVGILTVTSFYFATCFKTTGWVLVTIGQLILTMLYPVMLGGYHDTSVELYTLTYEISSEIFIVSSLFLFAGFAVIHWEARHMNNYFRFILTGLGILITVAFTLGFLEILTLGQVMMTGPIIVILYFGNAWMIYKLKD